MVKTRGKILNNVHLLHRHHLMKREKIVVNGNGKTETFVMDFPKYRLN